MPGIRFDDSAAAYVVLGAMALFFVVANGLVLYRHLTWASRVRRLLEQEGFTVRQMERRWLTKGPFQDMRQPGTKHHKEWLVRVVAEDREHRPRAGWVRWRRKWPWESADTWAVRWDEATVVRATAATAGRAQARAVHGGVHDAGSSSEPGRHGIGVYFLVRDSRINKYGIRGTAADGGRLRPCIGRRRRPPATRSAAAAGAGGFASNSCPQAHRQNRAGKVWSCALVAEFCGRPVGGGTDAEGLIPGTCAWLDRPLNDARAAGDPLRSAGDPHTRSEFCPFEARSPMTTTCAIPRVYWSFFVFNTNQGYLQATSHKRWTPPEAPQGSGAQR